MAEQELEVDISHGMCLSLRCTLDTRNVPFFKEIYSSEFRFQSGGWKLRFSKKMFYNLDLHKCSGVSPSHYHVSVHLERSQDGRTVDVLPRERRFTHEFGNEAKWHSIWNVEARDVLRSVPEFRLNGYLTLIVVLRVELEDSKSKASQTECSVAETTGESGSTTRSANCTKSTSVQTLQTTISMSGTPCLESLSNDLDQLMVDDSHHDFEFHCAGRTTKAHKLIVCQRSPVIASMLSTDMVEGRTGIVNIPNMAPDIFAQFLRYLYCGRVEELTFDTALRLYEAGDQYEVLGLAKRCSEYLMEHLSVYNTCEALVVFDAHNNRECVEKVVDFMVENRVPLVSEEWSAFCDEHPKLANKVLNRSLKAVVT